MLNKVASGTILIHTGTNNLDHMDSETFLKEYENMLADLTSNFPNSKIITSILLEEM